MNCPTCNHSDHVELDTHADGFAADLLECGDCGTMWTTKNDKIVLIHGATQDLNEKHARTECPICHNIDRVEIDIHSDGFAHNLEECGVCGALWSLDDNKPNLVHGATWTQ